MKKLLLVMAAAFAMVACQTDINEVGVVGGEVDVTFEVGTPTRAYSDGKTATVLQYAVYEGDTELTALTRSVEENNPDTINISKTVSFKLVTGNTYTVIFWAAAPNAPYTVDFGAKTMTVDYTAAVSNDENRDAFFKKHTFTVTGAQTEVIELRRPFAQLNIGTNDYAKATEAGYTPVNSAVKVTNVYETLDLWEGGVSDPVEILFDYNTIAKSEIFPYDDTNYDYLAMNYLLVPAEKEVVDIEFGYTESDAAAAKTRVVGSVPVQRNYRTNIYGQLLTSDVDINVVIKPEYIEPAHTADALFLAAAVGGEVTLTEDVVLTSALNVQSNMTLNLNGHNITIDAAYDSNNYEASSAIVNNATLTLTGNGEISATNNYTVRNNGTMVIDGVTVKNGIMNFGELTVESGNISNSRSGKHTIYGNAAKLTINGGTFHNENAGNAGIFAYGGEVVINGGEFTIADGTATFGWTSCLLDAQGGAKYTINGGVVRGEIRDYGKNTTIYGGAFSHYNSIKGFIAAGMKALQKGNLYYVVAEEVDAVATTAAELQAAISTVSDNATIVLADNFEFTEGANGTTNGISVTGAENFVLDLNGNTVTSNLGNIALRFKIGDGNGITNQDVAVTIKNGKVVSGANNWCAITAAAVNGNKITLNLENVEVESNKEGDCAVKSFSGAVINAKNVTVTSNAGGGFYAAGGEIVLDNCSAICTGATSWFVPLSISSSGKMTVNSGSYTIEPVDATKGQYLAYVMNSGGELVINGGTFNGTVATDGNQSKACGLICADTGAKVTLNGGTYNSNGAILDMRNNLGNASKNPSVLLGGGDYSNDPRVSGIYGSNLITVADGKTVAQGTNGRWTVE